MLSGCSFGSSLSSRFERFYARLIAAALFLFSVIISTAQAEPPAVPGEYLIKFKSASSNQRAAARNKLGVKFIKSFDITGAQLVSAQSGKKLNEKTAKELLANGQVEYIEPNYIVEALRTPNDPSFSQLWALNNTGQGGGTTDVDIDGPEAWDLTTGSSDVVVGVVDTGINYSHPDLAANMWTNPGEIPGNGFDDDGNGWVDDVYGVNTITHSGDPRDDNSHGSHTAGTIAASGSNGVGVTGVNWNLKLMALKFLDASGSGSTSAAITAIQYAVQMRARGVNIRVLSNSWGGSGYSAALSDAIASANNAGILFVAAAGNNGSDNDVLPTYPAGYQHPNVISVAAVDRSGNLASFSNYGQSSVDLAAPGVEILSTTLNSSYAVYNGTSMATPHVSGVAALVAGREPSLSPADLKQRLMNTVKALPTLTGLMAAPGIVSAKRALTNSLTPLPSTGSAPSYTRRPTAIGYDSSLGQKVLNSDDGYSEVQLPFSFPFYQQNYTRISVSGNGRIVPLAADELLPTENDYSNRVYAGISIFNDDLAPAPTQLAATEGGVWYKATSASAVFTWVSVNYGDRNSTDPETMLRVQLKIFSDGKIQFHYLDTHTPSAAYAYGASATVAIAPKSGADGTQLLVSSNTPNPSEIGSGKAIAFQYGAPRVRNDFDGDGISDVVVWRPSMGMWFILTSSSGFDYNHHQMIQCGLPGDIPLMGDFDGDARADLSVWRPTNGTWYFRLSSDNYANISSIQWGLYGDTPVPGDYDGDGRTDLAVYRTSSGMYYVLKSSTGFDRAGALSGSSQSMLQVSLGGTGNDPVIGDFSGGGKTNFTVVWQPLRFWSVKEASGALVSSLPWGEPGDTPLGCDWNGDGIDERIAVRIMPDYTLRWFAVTSSNLAYVQDFASFGDKPSCDKDFDGDGKGDLAVFRNSSGEWFIKQSSTGNLRAASFGLPGDIAL